ncbi:MAG TPA: hypothetical protein VFE62_20285 [Gemmataceae bacterium]|nr:hypothetical protein [Gemmataceae bacterium]
MRLAPPATLLFGFLIGCSGPPPKVSGTISCQGKGVPGSILFSPKGEGKANSGSPTSAQIKDDSTFEVRLPTVGKHTIVISPRDRKYPVKPGELDFPCELTPLERDIQAGANTLKFDLSESK